MSSNRKHLHKQATPSNTAGLGLAGLPLSNNSSNSNSSNGNGSTTLVSSSLNAQQYLTRALDVSQMDLQAALDQMRNLLSLPIRGNVGPHAVFKMAFYRKQTKNHWARDDPAFVVLQLGFMLAACLAYSIAFRSLSVSGVATFIVQSVLIHWLAVGLVMATVGKALAQRFMYYTPGASTSTSGSSIRHVKQSVEWLYAFDIHCNAFFPFFVVTYGVQFFLLPLVLGDSLVSLIVANTLYAVAFSWYFYITHLGYRALPFLKNTEAFLYPIAVIMLLWGLNIFGYPFGLGFNASRIVAYLYFPVGL